jgi:hypothetical protein
LRDLCDIAYVVQVQRLERRMDAIAAALCAAGADDALSIPDDARADFDAALCAAPPPPSKAELLRRQMGVA